ncbi:hypothetical protein BUE80_DR002487 [Diplocarpon rosae]|nr:hypothetical protein BUE80_DR002487 [Diplocarpon rosae]
MAETDQLELRASIDKFFLRSGLTAQDQASCYDFVEKLFPDKFISVASCQGYCSMTVYVGHDIVIQFRPYKYQLDLPTTAMAREVYGIYAPQTKYVGTLPGLGLIVYSMKRIMGTTFKALRERETMLGVSTIPRAGLCKDLAVFLSMSWSRASTNGFPLGFVGKSMRVRLQSLTKNLPQRFRSVARRILENLHSVQALPWVLTHGDIVAGNIMVDPSSGRLTGLVDWAEAEMLPFGTCFYGLEEMLGEITLAGFQYRQDAPELRTIFWTELKKHIPELGQSPVQEAVELARDLGVLLWHGIAFDDGAIDRVVQEGRDLEEIYKLDAFLSVRSRL